MTVIPWSPFLEPFESYDKLMQTVSRDTNGLIPAVDVYDQDSQVVVETALPGVDQKNVEISIENGILTIAGSSERKTEIDEKNYYRKEIRSGSFKRLVQLPAEVKESEAKASFKDGILKIEVPKMEKTQQKRISIKINEDKK